MDCSPRGSSVHGTFQARILGGGGCHFFLQGTFLDQGSNLGLLRWQVGSLPLSHWGSLLFAQPCNKPFCAAKKQKGRKEGKKEERKKAKVRGREQGRKGGMKKERRKLRKIHV